MPRFLLLAAASLVFLGAAAAGAEPSIARAPTNVYGERIAFDVMMKGETIGEHVVSFEPGANGLRVVARTEIAVDFLFFTAYEFTYRSRTLWRNGRIQSLSARTNDDGAVSTVTARRVDGALKIDGQDGTVTAPPDLLATDHWNPAAVEQGRLLNTITGRINEISVEDRGLETVETGSGPRRARRYAYRGELEADVWYDSAGRWVRLQFTRAGDRVITYVCRQCGGGAVQARVR